MVGIGAGGNPLPAGSQVSPGPSECLPEQQKQLGRTPHSQLSKQERKVLRITSVHRIQAC